MAFSVIIIKGAGLGSELASNAASPAAPDGNVFELIIQCWVENNNDEAYNLNV